VVSVTDAGSGVDPHAVSVSLDGHQVDGHLRGGRLTVHAARGSHELSVTASDYQELKNMEDVVKIKPNTATLTRTVMVR